MTADPHLPGLAGDGQLQTELDAVFAGKPAEYRPRTHHFMPSGQPRFVNRLIRETSPYLLQHAHNPVNWYAWGDEAFTRARQEAKPVFLSVGYSTCHWCHVMERESFEDEAIAEYLNGHYVAIKVDREERPDVDEVYMTALQALTGSGGWPMTVFMTPEREPFFAGTYFPPRDGQRGGGLGFLTVLQRVHHEYTHRGERVLESAAEIRRALHEATHRSTPSDDLPGEAAIEAGVAWFVRQHDKVWGGFGGAPKFPRPVALELLLAHSERTGDLAGREAALHTLRQMMRGGLRDHVGGGFHRYSVDDRWLIPHFEKMLYDNAQLVTALLDAYQCTADPSFAVVARETLDYLIAEMRSPDGGFYSATDADSLDPTTGESEEGWYFTWTRQEIDEALPVDLARAVHEWFVTTDEGNFEGRCQFHTPRDPEVVARRLGITPEVLMNRIHDAKRGLYEVRSRRPPPLRDDKILASWNGLTLSAFARAAWVLGDATYRDVALTLAEFLTTRLRDAEGRMLRSFNEGRASTRGFLDDHAFVVQGLIDLFECTFAPRWLDLAVEIQAQLDAHHHNPATGAYFTAPSDGEPLITRHQPEYDGAEPSGNSVTACNLLRLAAYMDSDDLRERALGMFRAQSEAIERTPMTVPKLLVALELAVSMPVEIFIVAGNDPVDALVDVLRTQYLPSRVIAVTEPSDDLRLAERIPALNGKLAVDGRSTAYVCERGSCQRPTNDPEELRAQIDQKRRTV